MTDYERETRTTVDDPNVTYVRQGGGATPWLIAAIVAVVAIIAVAFLMTTRADPAANDIAAAMDASRAAGYVEGANTAMSQVPVTIPVPIDTGAAERTAAEAAASAADARDAAERAADSASNAAASADTSVSSDTTP